MSFTTKAFALPALMTGGLLLSACGSMDKEPMYAEFEKTCKSSFVSEGGPAEMAQPFCDCSLEKVKEQDMGPMDMLDQEKMTALGEACANEVLADAGLGMDDAAAEPAAE